jgi:hypothetical protein
MRRRIVAVWRPTGGALPPLLRGFVDVLKEIDEILPTRGAILA